MKLNLKDDEEYNEGWLFKDISHLARTSFDKKAAHLGLTRSQWMAIGILYRHRGINQSQLAELLEIEKMSVVKLLDRLEKASWIERVPDKKDRRSNKIELTKKTDGIIKEMRKMAFSLRREYLKDFSQQEHDILLSYLNRIKTNLNQMCKKESL